MIVLFVPAALATGKTHPCVAQAAGSCPLFLCRCLPCRKLGLSACDKMQKQARSERTDNAEDHAAGKSRKSLQKLETGRLDFSFRIQDNGELFGPIATPYLH